jgi:hypothetical protein
VADVLEERGTDRVLIIFGVLLFLLVSFYHLHGDFSRTGMSMWQQWNQSIQLVGDLWSSFESEDLFLCSD